MLNKVKMKWSWSWDESKSVGGLRDDLNGGMWYKNTLEEAGFTQIDPWDAE